MDKFKFEAGFKAVCISLGYKFKSEEERADNLKVYYNTLLKNGYTDEIWENSVNRMILTFKPKFLDRFPTVIDFLDMAGLSVSVIAENAYKGIKKLIINIGGYDPISFGEKHKHDVAHEVVREMGGWYNICQYPMEWDNKKEQFIKNFERMFYECVPKNKPLLGKSTEANKRFLANYNTKQLTQQGR